MPIVNGRVHVRRHAVTPHHHVAYYVGVGAAVLIVAAGWVFTVGGQVRAFFSGVQSSVGSVSATIDQAKTNAAASLPAPAAAPTVPEPAAFVPALRAALSTENSSSNK